MTQADVKDRPLSPDVLLRLFKEQEAERRGPKEAQPGGRDDDAPKTPCTPPSPAEEIAKVLLLDAAATPGPWGHPLVQDGEVLPDGSGYAGGWDEDKRAVVLPAGPKNLHRRLEHAEHAEPGAAERITADLAAWHPGLGSLSLLLAYEGEARKTLLSALTGDRAQARFVDHLVARIEGRTDLLQALQRAMPFSFDVSRPPESP